MEAVAPIRCRLDDPGAEAAYEGFRDAVCAGKARRYAMLYRNAEGLRCKLENSGRCLDPDTSWPLVRGVVEPLLRFDPGTEWVAIFPVENWKRRLDDAVAAALAAGQDDWKSRLTEQLAAELPGRRRLVIER